MRGLADLLQMLLGGGMDDGAGGSGEHSTTITISSGSRRGARGADDYGEEPDEDDEIPESLMDDRSCGCGGDRPSIDELSDIDLPLALAPAPRMRKLGGRGSGGLRGLSDELRKYGREPGI